MTLGPGKQLIVAPEHAGMRLYRYIQLNLSTYLTSKKQCQQAIRAGEVYVNGCQTEETRILRAGDVITLRENARLKARKEFERLGLVIHLEVDNTAERVTVASNMSDATSAESQWRFLVAWKPAGAACLGVEAADTLARTLSRKAFEEEHNIVSSDEPIAFPSCMVYWLEKAACGWIVIARNQATLEALKQQLLDAVLVCDFRVMCKGRLGNKGALIELPADAITAESCDGSTSYAENAGLDEEDEQDIQDVQPTHTSQKSPIILPIRCEVALLTTSNHAGYLSTLNVWLDIHGRTRTGILDKQHTSNENDIPTFDVRAPTEAEIMLRRATLWKAGSLGRFIRRSLAAIHRPVIGVLPCAESLPSGRGKGYMLSVVRLRFRHPANQQELVFTCPEPTKFAAVRQREERFREQRRKRDDQALAEAGMSTDAIATASSTVPVAYLTGYKTFYNLRFHVTRDTLIPRQSTEALLDALHHMLSDNEDTRRGVGVRILDIGTGCGCLLLGALHSLPAAVGVGIDISDAALRVAETNALRLLGPPIHSDANHVSSECSNRRWHFICANMDTLDQPDTLAHLQHNCDVHLPFTHVLCNPPYLTEKRFRQHTSMSAEPQLALVGPDADGLGAYRSLATTLKSDQLLIPGGILILEVGYGLARQVIEKIFDAKPNDVPGCDSTSTWRIVEQRTDQHGLLRCLVFQKC